MATGTKAANSDGYFNTSGLGLMSDTLSTREEQELVQSAVYRVVAPEQRRAVMEMLFAPMNPTAGKYA